MSVASDAASLPAPELIREPETRVWPLSPDGGTLQAIEGLVEIGMTPMQALVSATKNGALAAQALDEYGTIEAGKSADLLLLDADPLDDIRKIRRQSLVMARGRVIDTAALPESPACYQARR
jgi:imidazolonepropionase-like amidohydrolase